MLVLDPDCALFLSFSDFLILPGFIDFTADEVVSIYAMVIADPLKNAHVCAFRRAPSRSLPPAAWLFLPSVVTRRLHPHPCVYIPVWSPARPPRSTDGAVNPGVLEEISLPCASQKALKQLICLIPPHLADEDRSYTRCPICLPCCQVFGACPSCSGSDNSEKHLRSSGTTSKERRQSRNLKSAPYLQEQSSPLMQKMAVEEILQARVEFSRSMQTLGDLVLVDLHPVNPRGLLKFTSPTV